jgi:hypothetical protein
LEVGQDEFTEPGVAKSKFFKQTSASWEGGWILDKPIRAKASFSWLYH